MDLSLRTENGSVLIYENLPMHVAHFVATALLDATPVVIVPASIANTMEGFIDYLADVAINKHNAETGACMCTSLSQSRQRDDGDGRLYYRCNECHHEVHNTRTHCGALR